MRSALWSALIWLCLVLATADPVEAECWFEWQDSLTFDRPIELSIELTTGRVVLIPSEDQTLRIEAVKRIFGRSWEEAAELAEKIRIKVTSSADAVSIVTEYGELGKKRSFLKRLLGGSETSFGDVEYRIAFPATRRVTISSLRADIELSGVQGDVAIDNRQGTSRAEFIQGTVTVKQPVGEIDLQWIEGDIRVESASGRVTINQVRGAIDLVTEGADVDIKTELDSPKDFSVRTGSGVVTFTVPRGSSGTLLLETATGRIETDLPLSIKSLSQSKVVGEFGGGGRRVRLSTESGDVTVAGF